MRIEQGVSTETTAPGHVCYFRKADASPRLSGDALGNILRKALAGTLAATMLPFSCLAVQAQQDTNVPPPPPDGSGQYGPPPQNGQYGPPQGGQPGYPQDGQGYGPPPPQDGQYGYPQAGGPPPGNYQPQGPDQLGQLVAPIALYPDSLVAQVLAAATYPAQVASAEQFVQGGGNYPPDQLAQLANNQPWDPSVKSLVAFPQVLSDLNRNMEWTTALGNAYYNQPQDVLNAVQVMRQRAYAAGNLRSTPQLAVVYDPGDIVIQPVSPAVVYVPYYNPWIVYGAPVPIYGHYYYGPPRGIAFGAGLAIGFGVGIAIGAFTHFGWGFHSWAPDWHSHAVIYNHNTYISRSVTVVNHGYYGGYDRSPQARAFNQGQAARFGGGYGGYNNRAGGYNNGFANRNGNTFNRAQPANNAANFNRGQANPGNTPGSYNRGGQTYNSAAGGNFNRGQAPAANGSYNRGGYGGSTQQPAAQYHGTAPGSGTYGTYGTNGLQGRSYAPQQQSAARTSPAPQQQHSAPAPHNSGGGHESHESHGGGGHDDHHR